MDESIVRGMDEIVGRRRTYLEEARSVPFSMKKNPIKSRLDRCSEGRRGRKRKWMEKP